MVELHAYRPETFMYKDIELLHRIQAAALINENIERYNKINLLWKIAQWKEAKVEAAQKKKASALLRSPRTPGLEETLLGMRKTNQIDPNARVTLMKKDQTNLIVTEEPNNWDWLIYALLLINLRLRERSQVHLPRERVCAVI